MRFFQNTRKSFVLQPIVELVKDHLATKEKKEKIVNAHGAK
jgi:hypothetical protein